MDANLCRNVNSDNEIELLDARRSTMHDLCMDNMTISHVMFCPVLR